MIYELIKLIVFILKFIYFFIVSLITYLYDYNSFIFKKTLENLNIYGSIENLDKYYNFKKNYTNGIALFTHTSYLDGLILATELQEAPSFVCLKEPLKLYLYDIAKKWNCLIINYNQKNAEVIKNNILNRNKNDPLLLIAPTGDNLEQINEFELNEFRTGPFISLSPVLPILISYNPHTYVSNKSTSILEYINILKTEKLNYKIKILDPIFPEKDDTIKSFKDNVYNIMNNERKNIKVDDIKVTESSIYKKIFTIIISILLLSVFIFSHKYNYILFIILFVITLIIICLRNKDTLFNFLYKNLIYIYSFIITIYSGINYNYLLFINSIIYPFLYNIIQNTIKF